MPIFSTTKHTFNLDIYDDGIGLNNRESDLNQEGHYGLTGLIERAESLGGHISIDSPPEFADGTRIHLRVPINSLGNSKEKST